MDLELAGKTAIVTGGSKGIGLAVVRALQAEGMRVVAGSRRPTPELKETGAVHVPVDLTRPEAARELVDRALAELGGIDLLVNNVGVGDTDDMVKGMLQDVGELPDDAWHHTFALHFYSALWVTRAALPSLVDSRGVIINVSSIVSRLVGYGPLDYAVSKGALDTLTKVVSEQFGRRGVRAINVSPGPVSTGAWTDPDGVVNRLARERGVPVEQFIEQFTAQMNPQTGRVSTPEEVARLIAFLASPNNITGADFVVDGGVLRAA